MSVLPSIRRATAQDSCPGALQVHPAADGGLARVRLPGGVVTRSQWSVLIDASADLGDGRLDLTSRGNLQLRGLDTGSEVELADRLTQAGLLPSPSHERVRNLLASPLTGRDRLGRADLRPLVAEFDRALLGRPLLADLSGRFLFALDDGRGDVAALGADVAVLATTPTEAMVLIAGAPARRVALNSAVATMLAAAEAFLAERAEQNSNAWRIGELADGPARVAARLHGETAPGVVPDGAPAAIGAGRQPDGRTALVVGIPLGRLDPAQARALAAPQLILTPWRSVVLPDLTDLAAIRAGVEQVGLITDPASPWLQVSACTGRPGCAKALADVRADAAAAAPSTTAPTHWSGCERRCGTPKGDVIDMLATGSGYLRNGVAV